MARVSIYVPDDLKGRMDAVGDAINWSNVVRPAIHAAIANFEHQKGQSMETAIERLRASKNEYAQEKTSDGQAVGRAWAQHRAEFGELKTLAECVEQDGWENGAYETLRGAIDPEHSVSYADMLEQLGLADLRANDHMPDEYWIAFIESAVEFYQEVEDQL